MLRTIGSALLVLGLGVVAAPLYAQSTLGGIRGTVRDGQGLPVARATLLAADEASGIEYAGQSEPTGEFELTNLRAGPYRLEASAPGFSAFRRPEIFVSAGDIVRIDVVLEIGRPTDVVTVSAASPVISIDSQGIQDALDARQLQMLPRNARDFQRFLYLSSNVVGDPDSGFQFLGGRTYGVSFVQDGQPSTGSLFGTVTNASPGLESISEVKVLTSSVAAEYEGLNTVIVTTRSGGNAPAGTAFYDFNGDALNALTYPQTIAGLRHGFLGSQTSDHQYAITWGGPLRKDRTFLLASFEGLSQSTVGGGSIVAVPTDQMRSGDFSASSFAIRDPVTGLPFRGNVIPSDRIDPAARRALDFFYPHANLSPLPNGIGRSQQFVKLATSASRWDLRLDHVASARDAFFGRVSWRVQNPGTAFEDPNFPNLGAQDRHSSSTVIATSWARSARRWFNEFHGGYVRDAANRQSNFVAADVASTLSLALPDGGSGRRGYPSFVFQGSNTIRGIADNSQNANRDTETGAFTLGDTLTWVPRRHAIKAGAQYVRRAVVDGYSLGVTGAAGSYVFSGGATGNSFADFLLGLPARTEEGIDTRGTRPLDAYAHDLAAFVQDDWRPTSALTLFLGMRYQRTGSFVERHNLLVNFDPRTGALVLPSAGIAQFLSSDARRLPLELATDLGVGPSLVRSTSDFAPRAGFAVRIGSDDKTVIRASAGYFHPLNAAQGIRDALSRAPFRFARERSAPIFTQGFSSGALSDRSLFGVNAVDMNLMSPEALQFNATLERELASDVGLRLSYIGTRFRKLLVNRDLNTLPPSTAFFDLTDPSDRSRLPYPNLDPFLNMVENAGSGYFRALQAEARRRTVRGLGFSVAYTLAGSESTAPDLGNSTLGVVQYAPYDLELDRGPDPNVVKHRVVVDAIWEVPLGRGGRFLTRLPTWVDAVAGGWTVAGIFQARSGQHLTPFFRYGSDPIFPANTGKAYDTNSSFDEAWRPDVVGDPNGPGDRNSFFNLDAFRLPARGTVGNAKKGVIEGPGTWVVNLGLYKMLRQERGWNAEFRLTLDNAFNHPQFLVTSTSGFLDVTDFLINGIRNNGVTNVLSDVGSLEGFAPARVIRLGVRVRF